MFVIKNEMLDRIARGQYNPNIKKTLEYANDARSSHRLNTTKGYTKKKEMRFIGEVPKGIFFHPEFQKYWDPRMDQDELRKSVYKFLRKYPQYCVVDKL